MRVSEPYTTIEIYVEPGHILPQVGKPYFSLSIMTDILYRITVKKISAIEWAKDGAIRVRIQGIKKAMGAHETQDAG